jgi:hypothetical protein
MIEIIRTFDTGDPVVPRKRASALEVDRLISELGQLYLERIKVLRTGDQYAFQMVTHKISMVKIKLNQL